MAIFEEMRNLSDLVADFPLLSMGLFAWLPSKGDFSSTHASYTAAAPML